MFKLMNISVAISTVMALALTVTAAQRKHHDSFARGPAKTRARLTERLRLMLELESKDDRSALYDMMFGPPYAEDDKRGIHHISGEFSHVHNFEFPAATRGSKETKHSCRSELANRRGHEDRKA
jgi:hypothetical protein